MIAQSVEHSMYSEKAYKYLENLAKMNFRSRGEDSPLWRLWREISRASSDSLFPRRKGKCIVLVNSILLN